MRHRHDMVEDLFDVHRFVDRNIQSIPGVKVTISGFNSTADSESKTSYTHGSNSQRFISYDF